jgi:[glutamine synthetase] adenylyltransferase / [glutamine synthetase]-adenylyl-L-tyrosine phosphorylase
MSEPALDVTRARERLETHAPALLGLVRADPGALQDVLRRPLALESDAAVYRRELAAALGERPEDGPALYRSLRRYRHRAIIRIALREITSAADIAQTSEEMALLASALIDAALDACASTQRARHGPALDAEGAPIASTVLGMGKLGGLELNLGSDVDLVFFYETDDGAAGELTVHEHFARVAQRTVKALGDVTEDGFCFRVDLRLRPEGSRGPLVNSLASAERYYQTWGRTWERAAMLRARPVAGDLVFGWRLLGALTPFIYRRQVDPGVAEAMYEMLLRARRELAADERDLKLGRGGIREAEFFVQALQLIWGGQHPELRVPGTMEALTRLRGAGLVTGREAATLERIGRAHV